MSLISRIMRKIPQKKVTPEEPGSVPISCGSSAAGKPTITDGKDADGEYEILEREILPEKIICPDCGGITLEGLDYCDKCGGEL